MKFTIDKTGKINGTSWGSVDKLGIMGMLKNNLQSKAEGVKEAIKEVYAVIKSSDIADSPSTNWFGPHHVIEDDGTVMLSRAGVIAAYAALQGARSKPDLTPEQISEAEDHLKKHYEELGMKLPAGEMVLLQANLCGEMAVDEVPLAPGVDLQAIKAGDSDPVEIVMEIPAGKSKRDWNYTPQAMQSIVRQVATQTAAGYLGHQKPEDVNTEFKIPVTHWVGAKYENGKAYVRGVIDKAAVDLKRWVKAGRIKQVSIFGNAHLAQAGGETNVVDYDLMSIDWTPLDRAGMPTRIVAVGEMMDNIITPAIDNNNGGGKMNFAQIIEFLRTNKTSITVLAGEMGWKPEDLVKELMGAQYAELQANQTLVGEMAKAMGVGATELTASITAVLASNTAQTQLIGEMAGIFGLAEGYKPEDLVTAVKAAHQSQVDQAVATHNAMVDKVVGEMVQVEAARPLVKRMLVLQPGQTEDEVKKVVGEMLQQEDVKKAMEGMFSQHNFNPNSGGNNTNDGLSTKKVAI